MVKEEIKSYRISKSEYLKTTSTYEYGAEILEKLFPNDTIEDGVLIFIPDKLREVRGECPKS